VERRSGGSLFDVPVVEDSRAGGDGKALSCTVFRDGASSATPPDLGEISEILKEENTFVWFDVLDPGPNDLALLQEEFDLHPLAVEDAVQAHERPKIESYNSYWFVIVLGTTLKETEVIFHEVAVFAGVNFVVTVRHNPPYPLEEIERRLDSHKGSLRRGGGFLLYTILDTIVDGYFPVAERFQDRVDELEQVLFAADFSERKILQEIFQMKKDAQQFRWAALPLRDTLNPIIRGDMKLFADDEIAYFRDVYDHAVHVIDQLDTVRDLVNSSLEIHLSVVANRQNEVAKQLTIIATIFLPLSFIVGFFGQNFLFLTNNIQTTAHFWFLGIGSEIGALAVMFYYFKRKGWF
jgi:magnesium transporter